MKSVKDKMYNYQVEPPPQSWQIIATALDEVNFNTAQSLQKNNKRFYYSLAAAAITIIICTVFIRFTASTEKKNETVTAQSISKSQQVPDDKITVPEAYEDEPHPAGQTGINNPVKKLQNAAFEPAIKKYIIISGPQGQPVKISSKVASLIISSDDQHPPNPVWNEKVMRWKDIMKANILGPATVNFLDVVDLTNALKINN